MTDKFKGGDFVQLKSGGPRMTVSERIYGGDYQCKWFAGSKLNVGRFAENELHPYPEDDKKAQK